MKCLTLFVHASAEHALVDALRADERASGFTLTRCQGHSRGGEDDPFLGARDRVIGYVPRLRLDVVLADGDVEGVLATLREAARSGVGGGASLGTWQLTEVLEFGRL